LTGKRIDEVEVAFSYIRGHTTEEKFDFVFFYTWKQDYDCNNIFWYLVPEDNVPVNYIDANTNRINDYNTVDFVHYYKTLQQIWSDYSNAN
jgi:hypothetical protein